MNIFTYDFQIFQNELQTKSSVKLEEKYSQIFPENRSSPCHVGNFANQYLIMTSTPKEQRWSQRMTLENHLHENCYEIRRNKSIRNWLRNKHRISHSNSVLYQILYFLSAKSCFRFPNFAIFFITNDSSVLCARAVVFSWLYRQNVQKLLTYRHSATSLLHANNSNTTGF